MYTLEDDKETTSSLRKRDFDSTSQAPDGSGGAATGALHHPPLSTQVTSSFKKITTLAQPQAGGKGVALGALTMACIGVFFTTMDQTAALIIAMADIPIFVDTVLQRPVLDSGLALLRLTA